MTVLEAIRAPKLLAPIVAMWLAGVPFLGASTGCGGAHTTFALADSPAPSSSDCDSERKALSPRARDVVVVVDASRSTVDPTGLDIDSDGTVSEPLLGSFGLKNDVGGTDPGDSLYAAQVFAVLSLIRELAGSGVRFGIVAFAERWDEAPPVEAPLGSEIVELEAALADLAARDPEGATSFAAGMRFALKGLAEWPDPRGNGERMVLLIADGPEPTDFPGESESMMEAARYALQHQIPFHTFGIGEAAAQQPPFSLSRIAESTRGTYHPVPDPRQLHCALLRALH